MSFNGVCNLWVFYFRFVLRFVRLKFFGLFDVLFVYFWFVFLFVVLLAGWFGLGFLVYWFIWLFYDGWFVSGFSWWFCVCWFWRLCLVCGWFGLFEYDSGCFGLVWLLVWYLVCTFFSV